MSKQVEFLINLIASVQAGHDGAEAMLREICQNAAKAAPVNDLITIAQCLCTISYASIIARGYECDEQEQEQEDQRWT